MTTNTAPTDQPSKRQLERELERYSITASQAGKPGKNASWLAFGAAASAGLLGSTAIEAAILYSGPQNLTLSSTAKTFIDFDGGGNDFSMFVSSTGADGRIVGLGTGNIVAVTSGYTAAYAQRFSSGQLIGTPASSLGPVATGPFIDRAAAGFTSNTGFIGVQLASGNYGWIQFHFGGLGNPSTVFDWAYDDSGAHIQAGDTGTSAAPEPGTMMLLGMGGLAMGATGLRALRRRRREAAAGPNAANAAATV